jgi:hypothetical protein
VDFLGIERESVFSPGKVDADAAILRSVGDELSARGQTVHIVGVEEAQTLHPAPTTIVFAMCQGEAALALLETWQRRGIRVINRPGAILDSQRFRAIPRLATAGVALPRTLITATVPDVPDTLGDLADEPLWVKRGDVHATEAADVVQVVGRDALAAALQRFRQRGIERVALQRHVAGRVFKFYGVAGGFFHCVVPPEELTPQEDTRAVMAKLGEHAAQALGLEVYGGDCVHDEQGRLHLIDLNDWPSYGPCRAGAAAAIAAYIHAQKDRACR